MDTRPLLICGPSGTGKSTLVKHLVANSNFGKVITATTRKPRADEKYGVHYYFMTPEEYKQSKASGAFFMDNYFLGANYGTLTSEITRIRSAGLHPVMETFAPTIPQFRQEFPDTLTIYLYPDNLDTLRHRMVLRGDKASDIDNRMISAQEELDFFNQHRELFDHITVLGEKSTSSIAEEVWGLFSVYGPEFS